MKYFVPVSTHSSPSRRAVVEIRWEFEPASGSVMAKAILSRPEASGGSHVDRWCSVPYRDSNVPQMAGETSIMSSGQPAAATSSHTMASSEMPMPPPP